MSIYRKFGIAALLTLVSAGFAHAQNTANDGKYLCQFLVCQVWTNISGESSQTLPGIKGSVQKINEQLDGVKLVMEGETLTWNGKESPEDPNIRVLSAPKITTEKGQECVMEMIDPEPLQYFAPAEKEKTYTLMELPQDQNKSGLRVALTVNPAPGSETALNCNFNFSYGWIKDREKIEGVKLNVGKPIMGEVVENGPIGALLNEWVCYRTHIESRGFMYVFMRISKA
jgi:hypothetical protein